MDWVEFSRFLPDELATICLGEDIAAAIGAGDFVALSGELGTGKTTLARGLIRALASNDTLDVVSPTFTLVQTYDARFPVVHVDLYRIASPDDVDELGLEEALDTRVTIVEWLELAKDRLPVPTISIKLIDRDAGRLAEIKATGLSAERLERSFSIRRFLQQTGSPSAHRAVLMGDASTRVYESISGNCSNAGILMNAPKQPDGPPIRQDKPYSQIAHLAESVEPFVAIAQILREKGFAAPRIYARDLEAGLLLIENLGSGTILDNKGLPLPDRYEFAGAQLARLHAMDWPEAVEIEPGIVHRIPAYDRDAMMIEVELTLDWYFPYVTGKRPSDLDVQSFRKVWNGVMDRIENQPRTLVLRDYHSPNLIWRKDAAGADRLGLLDFQDAVIGPGAYDLASLAQDARVSIPVETELRTVNAYLRQRTRSNGKFDPEAFLETYAIMAAQRNSKLLGIFVRLDRRDGKSSYLAHLPRIRGYLGRVLSNPALAPVNQWFEERGLLPLDCG